MKKILLLFILVFFFNKANSQVVFCPPGAEWRALFIQNNLSSIPTFWNEKIYYSGDTVMGLDTFKILKHTKFFMRVNWGFTKITLLKQRGDTIFIRNIRTNHQWQVLYNFNVNSGSSWTFTTYGVQTHANSFSVDSVKNVIINSIQLKQIYVKINGLNEIITERFGCNLFLFPFYNNINSDGDYLFSNLCYSDNTIGFYKFGQYPCDVQTILDINSWNSNFNSCFYPNPTNNFLNIEIPEITTDATYLKLLDIQGQVLLEQKTKKEDNATNSNLIQIDVSGFNQGIYFLQIWDKGKLVALEKIMKE